MTSKNNSDRLRGWRLAAALLILLLSWLPIGWIIYLVASRGIVD